MTQVPGWIQQLTEDVIGGSPLEVGKRYMHPEDGVIEVTDGQFWGTHGLSNFWHWTVVATGEKKHGYGGPWPLIEQKPPVTVTVRVKYQGLILAALEEGVLECEQQLMDRGLSPEWSEMHVKWEPDETHINVTATAKATEDA